MFAIRKLLLLVLVGSFILPAADAEARRRRRRRYGTLQLNSTTDGAEVFVDGEQVGVLPLQKPLRLKPGKHTLKLVKPGYTQYLDVFRIKRRKITTLDIDLLPVAGIVDIRANVDKARVFIDGKFAGTTPLRTEVPIGKHTIRVKKVGHYEIVKKHKAIAGKVSLIDVKLKLMPVGTTPYRPPPPPPPKWYEKWYVWAGAAGGLVAVALAIIVPVVLTSGDPITDFDPDHHFSAK